VAFLVLRTPGVDDQLRRFGASALLEFERVCIVLSVRPIGTRATEETEVSGRKLYTYQDPLLPFLVRYRVFEPETGEGLVVITALVERG